MAPGAMSSVVSPAHSCSSGASRSSDRASVKAGLMPRCFVSFTSRSALASISAGRFRTVFWCDGADVPGRFGRLGAAISGAALQGYYVDLSMVAVDLARWESVRDASRGTRRPSLGRWPLRPQPPRGAARHDIAAARRGESMRLAVMSDRSRGGDGPGSHLEPMTLSELAAVVAVHEEGHLCDRGSWYPLGVSQVLRLISFGAAHGFDGQEIARALEARAQLVALCVAEDVRLPWVDLLDAAEGGGAGVTPHGRAYRRLLQDLIDRLEAEVQSGAGEISSWIPMGAGSISFTASTERLSGASRCARRDHAGSSCAERSRITRAWRRARGPRGHPCRHRSPRPRPSSSLPSPSSRWTRAR